MERPDRGCNTLPLSCGQYFLAYYAMNFLFWDDFLILNYLIDNVLPILFMERPDRGCNTLSLVVVNFVSFLNYLIEKIDNKKLLKNTLKKQVI